MRKRPNIFFFLFAVAIFSTGCSGLKVANIKTNDYEATAAQRIEAELAKTEIPVSVPLVEAWVYNAGGAFGPVRPLLVGDYVIAGTRRGEIHAVSLSKGRKAGSDSFGDAIDGTPTMYGTDIIVPVAWGSKKSVVSHDLRSGSKSWSLRVPPVPSSILRIAEDVVFIDNESVVHSVRAEDGVANWINEFDVSIPFHASPVELSDALVAVINGDGTISAIRKDDGSVVWQRYLDTPVHANAVTDGSRLYVSTTRGRLFAVNVANGSIEWQNTVGHDEVRVLTGSLFDDNIVVGASSGKIAVYERGTGLTVWETLTPEAVAARPLVTRDYIFVSSMDRTIRALDRHSGDEHWYTELKGRAKSEMVAADNSLVVLSEPRLMYHFTSDNGEVARAN